MSKKVCVMALFILFVGVLSVYAATVQIPTRGKVSPTIGVNVRTGPGTNYTKITAIPCGHEVEIVAVSGTWYKIKYGSYSGYSIASAITVTETREEEIDDDDSAKRFMPTLLNVDPSTR
jgi:uncharacterized protein YraI